MCYTNSLNLLNTITNCTPEAQSLPSSADAVNSICPAFFLCVLSAQCANPIDLNDLHRSF